MNEQNRSTESNTTGSRGRFVTTLRILNVRLRFIMLMAVVGLVAAKWDGITARIERIARPQGAAETAGALHEFYCPMHPSVVRADEGNCPICGMPLTKRLKGEKAQLPEGVLGRVEITQRRIRLAGVGVSELGYRSFSTTIRTVGTIELDERRVAEITARVSGRVEKLIVDFTGESISRRGALLELYSPDLVSAQQEYLLALRNQERLSESGPATAAEAKLNFESARQRLKLWGIGEDQIAEIEASGVPQLRIPILSPIAGTVIEKHVVAGQLVDEGADLYTVADLSSVWMTAHVFEKEIGRVKVGDLVRITASSLPGRSLDGRVAFIWPVLDEETRTVRVRADVPNPEGILRPGMYVDATIETGTSGGAIAEAPALADRYICPMHPEVEQEQPGRCGKCGMFLEKVAMPPGGAALAVPESSVIDTGARKVVFVEREEGIFDAIAVDLGPLANGYYPVLSGLAPGERVVTAGAFLIDAENRLNPGAAGSYFGASGGPAGGSSETTHDHD